MNRRQMLKTSAAAALGAAAFPTRWVAAAEGKKPQKVLFFTRNVGFYHSVVVRKGGQLSHAEKIVTELGKKHGFEVVCAKDGGLFDGDIAQYDAFLFYCNGNLTKPNKQKEPPMTPAGAKRLLDAIAGGKGFVGFHSTCNCWRTGGPAKDGVDPFIGMLGGGFVSHGPQQKATMRIASPDFPGLKGLGDSFALREEWYAMKSFAKDMHVLLVQETAGMKGKCYARPPFPSTWARMQGKGRVFFTALGHREDIWTNELCQQIILGGIAWTLGNAPADVTPNIAKVTPKAGQLTM